MFLQSSPVQAICLLILLSFWSVSDTCIQLLKPTTTLNGVKGWRVALQPNIQYLKDPYHIVTWIISTVLLIFLLVPFILLLYLSPLLRCKFNQYLMHSSRVMMTSFARTGEYIYTILDNFKYQHALLCYGDYSCCCWYITFHDTSLQVSMAEYC